MTTRDDITKRCTIAISLGAAIAILGWSGWMIATEDVHLRDKHRWDQLQREVSDTDNYPHWSGGTLYQAADGDSVEINYGFMTRDYALTGINAPDSGDAAEASRQAIIEKLSDKRVYVHWDKVNGGVKYVTLFVDGENVNKWMIDNGYAEAE